MGITIHHAIVVTSWSEEQIARAHGKARDCCPGFVSSVVKGRANGYVSFFIAPDGSNEGWPESKQGDDQRDDFISWMRAQGYSTSLEWVLIEYGDRGEGGFGAEVINSSYGR
jgi:hypothetical protein